MFQRRVRELEPRRVKIVAPGGAGDAAARALEEQGHECIKAPGRGPGQTETDMTLAFTDDPSILQTLVEETGDGHLVLRKKVSLATLEMLNAADPGTLTYLVLFPLHFLLKCGVSSHIFAWTVTRNCGLPSRRTVFAGSPFG